MRARDLIVVDVGKTSAKATLCDFSGIAIARRERPNSIVESNGRRLLDAAGIEAWLRPALRELAALGEVSAIVTVGHGAAAALVRDGTLIHPPLDYEQEIPEVIRLAYEKERDPFAATGSPLLPLGLNLGAQLYRLHCEEPTLFDGRTIIVPWPQYWSWRLSGVAASEISSLGCHTDLWRPFAGAASALAERFGWANRMAPLRDARAELGPILPDWAESTGIPPDAIVHCGSHDSNAALFAARGYAEMTGAEATVLSTGTWFVAMRSAVQETAIDPCHLPERRDCLVNVDIAGRPVPTARFMGGREIQLLSGEDGIPIDDASAQAALLAAMPVVIEQEAMILPTMVSGSGPYPQSHGCWQRQPAGRAERAAAIALYAALVADAALDLIGAGDRLLVEGRFAASMPFVRALGALRRSTHVFVAEGGLDITFGACRIANPRLDPPSCLKEIPALEHDLVQYRARWRAAAEAGRMN